MTDQERIEQLEEQLKGLQGEYDKLMGDFAQSNEDRKNMGNALTMINIQLSALRAATSPMKDMVDAMMRIGNRALGNDATPEPKKQEQPAVAGLRAGVAVEEAADLLGDIAERHASHRISLDRATDGEEPDETDDSDR